MQKFQIELHQLTPNTIVQLSKFVWVVSSCGGPTLHQPCMDQVRNGRMNHIFEVVGEKYVRQTKHAARGAQKLKVVETWEAEVARSKTKDAKRWKRASL
jgi:hypothetical protein